MSFKLQYLLLFFHVMSFFYSNTIYSHDFLFVHKYLLITMPEDIHDLKGGSVARAMPRIVKDDEAMWGYKAMISHTHALEIIEM